MSVKKKKVPSVADVPGKLTPRDVVRIKEEMASLERQLRAGNDIASVGTAADYRPAEVPFNPDELKKRHGILRNTLEREAPQKALGVANNRALKEYEALCNEWQKSAITKKEQDMFPGGRPSGPNQHTHEDFVAARDKCLIMENSPRIQYVAQRIKQLAGMIDPEDPTLRDLEKLRRRR